MNRFSHAFSSLCLALSLTTANQLWAATNTVTTTGNTGAGSLRQTVLDAVSGDVIIFSVTGTITLTTGEIALDKDLTIAGPGADTLAVSGNNASRIFSVLSNATVSISGLSLTAGNDTNGTGGAILNAATLTISDCSVNSSSAGSTNAASGGGGIFNAVTGVLAIQYSTIDNNQATGGAGDESGGGVYNNGGSVTISNSTLSANVAAGTNGIGGAVYNPDGVLEIIETTIALNTSAGNGGGVGNLGGTVVVTSSIIASNVAATCPDASGGFASGGFNLIGVDEGTTGFVNGDNDDQVGTLDAPLDPLVGPLANNGGPTLTLALLPGSLAINAGSCDSSTNDQRGLTRPVGLACDIGSFELQACSDPSASISCITTDLVATAFVDGGAAVTFDDPSFSTTCPGATVAADQPSGSVFAPGTNVVTFSLLDASGTELTNCTFNIIVLPPENHADDAIAIVQSFGLDPKLEAQLVKKLQKVKDALISGDRRKACSTVRFLVAKTNHLFRKGKITVDQANQLFVPLSSIQGFLSCR